MADCMYCGKPAGVFRKKHRECDKKYRAGYQQMVAIATAVLVNGEQGTDLDSELREIARKSYHSESSVADALIEGWERAVDHFLDDGQLDEGEEQRLVKYARQHSFSQEQLDRRGAYSRLVKGAVLRDILNGVVPQRFTVEGRLPFNFQKTERLIWAFKDTKYYEDRKRRTYVGGSQGFSIRIAKGVYYRVGAFKGYPVEQKERVFVGSGLMAVTDRHIYFTGGGKSFRIRHDKVVTIEPFSDGVGLHRDAQTARPQYFITGDGWFTYNLLVNVSQLE
ncbi:MAG: hypothetical protein H0Z37_11030 [Firmicutes bacterium]|nr:hypothetical protein [Bacillota bacterium]